MNTLFNQEMKDAARGIVAVLRGNSEAENYFDLGLRGLAGSMVAFLVAAVFNAFLPGVMGGGAEVGGEAATAPTASMALLLVGVVFVFQTVFGALALNQFGKFDGLVPYLVVSNWATFFFTGLFSALRFINLSAVLFLLIMVVLLILSEINILRLIVKLKGIQIAMFIVAQFVGALTGLMLITSVFPNTILIG